MGNGVWKIYKNGQWVVAATVGATFGDAAGTGTNILGQITQSNISTFIANAAIQTAQIGNAAITNAKIGKIIASDDFNGSVDALGNIVTDGTTGWAAGKGGRIVGYNLKLRGDITATSLNAATGTFSGELVAATGSFGGQLLAGVLDFAQLSGTTYNYNSPGTYTITVPSDKTSMRVTLIGAGGAGGGNTNMYDTGGGGGGGGGVTTATFTGLTPGATYTLTVGAGGVPTNSGTNQPSGAGGHTYISGLTSANNGGQGGRNSQRAEAVAGGAGGTGTSANGAAGQSSPQNGGWDTGEAPLNPGGAGGNSAFGAGGAGGVGTNAPGSNGSGYGGGGGGAGQTTGSYLPGGYGAGGRAIVEFFNPNSVVIRSEWNTLISKLNAQGIATS